MLYVTISTMILYNIVWLYDVLVKKNFWALGTVINFTVVFNFALYLCKWSLFVNSEPSLNTYIFINLILVSFIIIMLMSKSPIEYIKNEEFEIKLKNIKFAIGRIKISIYMLINVIFILLFFIENYLGSKSFIPNLVGKDIHGYSAPLISFITRALFVIIFINYLYYETYKQKKYIYLTIFEILMFIITRGARMTVFVACFQFLVFFWLYKYKKIYNNNKIKSKIIILITIMILIGLSVGINRVNKQWANAERVVTYEEQLLYTGPEDPMALIPWYYGYFPMSYENLDASIRHIDNSGIRTYGTYSLRPLLVGVFQLDNVLDYYKDIEFLYENTKFHTPVATVPTGFLEFYIDFGIYGFIPVFIYAFIAVLIYNNIENNRYNIVYYSLYFGMWLFMCFQNYVIEVVMWYSLFYLLLVNRYLIVKERNNTRI